MATFHGRIRDGDNNVRERARLTSSRPPCRFFLLGKCKFGESCTFSHEPQGRLPTCTFFAKNGQCRYGDDCKFLHGAENTDSSARTSGANVEEGGSRASHASGSDASGGKAAGLSSEAAGNVCGICLENIPASGKRFGLLNCDHVYCLECLRTWRKSKGAQKDISRTCPECRKVSFFVVPSKEHLKGKEKVKALYEYKRGLSKLPCKYHKPDGSTCCPFGWRCFYAHLDKDGVDVKDRVPATQASVTYRGGCPYLRNGTSRRGGRGSSSGRGSHASQHRGLVQLDRTTSESVDDEEDVGYRHLFFLSSLQELMIDSEAF